MPSDFNLFKKNGGSFITPVQTMKRKMLLIKAFVFDWDGVFNDGRKTGTTQSYFTEIDSMGLNLVRFSNWMAKNKKLPYSCVMSGEETETASFFMSREHFHYAYFKAKDKTISLKHFCQQTHLKPQEIAFVYDDVLDLSVAAQAGLRICVRRAANPLLIEYIKKNKLADYITGCTGGNYPLREACELMIALNGNFEQVLKERIDYSPAYSEYLKERNKPSLKIYSVLNNVVKIRD